MGDQKCVMKCRSKGKAIRKIKRNMGIRKMIHKNRKDIQKNNDKIAHVKRTLKRGQRKVSQRDKDANAHLRRKVKREIKKEEKSDINVIKRNLRRQKRKALKKIPVPKKL